MRALKENVIFFLPFLSDTEVMEALLILSASAFALAALGWFITWAFWIHPPEGWLGKPLVSIMPPRETDAVRHAAWFRWLRIVTVLLGLTTLALFGIVVTTHS